MDGEHVVVGRRHRRDEVPLAVAGGGRHRVRDRRGFRREEDAGAFRPARVAFLEPPADGAGVDLGKRRPRRLVSLGVREPRPRKTVPQVVLDEEPIERGILHPAPHLGVAEQEAAELPGQVGPESLERRLPPSAHQREQTERARDQRVRVNADECVEAGLRDPSPDVGARLSEGGARDELPALLLLDPAVHAQRLLRDSAELLGVDREDERSAAVVMAGSGRDLGERADVAEAALRVGVFGGLEVAPAAAVGPVRGALALAGFLDLLRAGIARRQRRRDRALVLVAVRGDDVAGSVVVIRVARGIVVMPVAGVAVIRSVRRRGHWGPPVAGLCRPAESLRPRRAPGQCRGVSIGCGDCAGDRRGAGRPRGGRRRRAPEDREARAGKRRRS